MRVPGIRTIAVAECKGLPADLELTAASGLQPNVSGVSFKAVPFVGDPICDIESTNENNGAASSVKMTFCVPFKPNYRRHCFAVSLATGETYLIGSKESIPMVTWHGFRSAMCLLLPPEKAARRSASNHGER